MTFEHILNALLLKGEMWGRSATKLFPNFVVAIVVLLAFVFVGRLVRSVFIRTAHRFSENIGVNRLLASLIYVIIVTIGFFVGLGLLGLDRTVASLLAGAGIVGLAIGFAFQEIIANLISGIIITFQRPFLVGDIVAVNNVSGTVDRINLRASVIRTFDGQETTIPNKNMLTETLTNFTRTGLRRITIDLGIGYDSDLGKVEAILREAVESISLREPSRPVEVMFQGFGESAINLKIYFWVPFPGQGHFSLATNEAIRIIHKTCQDHQISIPFPMRTVEIKSGNL